MADLSPQLTQLMSRIARLGPMQVEEVERTVARLEALAARQEGEKESGDKSPHSRKVLSGETQRPAV